MGRLARALLRIVALTFARDRLGTSPGPEVRRGRPLLAAIFGRETLPLDEPGPARPRGHVARLLLAPEHLPVDVETPLARRRRSAWLRWLFGREPLDPR